MWRAILHIWNIVKEEAKRRGWIGVIKALFWLAGLIGFSLYALHPLIQWLFPQSVVAVWVIMISFSIVVTLLVVINFIHTYYERTKKEALDIWNRNIKLLKDLYILRRDGGRLSYRYESPNDNNLPADEVRSWHRNVARILEDIDIEYRRRFYEHSETGETAPDNPYRCKEWIDVRLYKLDRVIAQLERPPAQLIPHKIARQLERDGLRYLETDMDYSDYQNGN